MKDTIRANRPVKDFKRRQNDFTLLLKLFRLYHFFILIVVSIISMYDIVIKKS